MAIDLADIILPILACLVIVATKVFNKNSKWRDRIEIALAIGILGFSIFSSMSNSDHNVKMEEGISELIQTGKNDSINNALFQAYLEDSFRIERVGNKAQIISQNTFINNTTTFQSSENKPKTFKLTPTGMEGIEKMFRKVGYNITNLNPTFKLDCTYSGEFDKVAENLYRYSGGVVLIKLNGSDCKLIQDLEIKPTFYGGNHIGVLEAQLNEVVKKLCEKNSNKIFHEITNCIN